MANRAYLISNTGNAAIAFENLTDESVLVASNYHIPILWLAMFTKHDIVRVTTEIQDEDGNFTREEYPLLLVNSQIGKQRVIEREKTLFTILPLELKQYFQEWITFLNSVTSKYIALETCEIWIMEDDFEDKLRKYLDSFDSLNVKDWEEILEQASMSINSLFKKVSYDPNTVKFNMRGYKWVQPVTVTWRD